MLLSLLNDGCADIGDQGATFSVSEHALHATVHQLLDQAMQEIRLGDAQRVTDLLDQADANCDQASPSSRLDESGAFDAAESIYRAAVSDREPDKATAALTVLSQLHQEAADEAHHRIAQLKVVYAAKVAVTTLRVVAEKFLLDTKHQGASELGRCGNSRCNRWFYLPDDRQQYCQPACRPSRDHSKT